MRLTSNSLSQYMCFQIIIDSLLTVKSVYGGEWEQTGQQRLRFVIQSAKLVNTTVVRNGNSETDKQCTYKFMVHFPNEKQASIGCLVFDTGRRPALEHAKLLVYGNGFGKIKVTRPLTKLAPFLFSGSILGDPDSVIYGTIAQGAFIGTIRKGRNVFHIEKSTKYLQHNNKTHFDTKFKQGPTSHMPRQILLSGIKMFRKHSTSRLKRDSEAWDYPVPDDHNDQLGSFISSELDDNIVEELYTPDDDMMLNESTKLDKVYRKSAYFPMSLEDKGISADKNGSTQHDLPIFPLDEHTSAVTSHTTGKTHRVNEFEKRNLTNSKNSKSEAIGKSFKEKTQFHEQILQFLGTEARRIFRNEPTKNSSESNASQQGLPLGTMVKPPEIIIGTQEKAVDTSENLNVARSTDEQHAVKVVIFNGDVETGTRVNASVLNEKTKPKTDGTTSASTRAKEDTTPMATTESLILDSRQRLVAETDRVLQSPVHQPFMLIEKSTNEKVTTLESSADMEKSFYVESDGDEDNDFNTPKDAKIVPSVGNAQATLTSSPSSRGDTPTDERARSHQLREVFGLNGGMIWNLTLACDYGFYSSIGDENIGITVGRLLYLFDLAEWVIRSSDWNEDFLPDNFGFVLRNVAIEIEPGKTNNRIEKFKSVAKDTKNSLTIAFSSQSTDDVVIMNNYGDDNMTRARCDGRVVAIVSTEDAARRGLPDAILVQRILDAILRFMGLDEIIRNKCDAAKMEKTADGEQVHVIHIDACIRREVSKKVVMELAACSSRATVAYCGNGIIEAGEDCDCGSLATCWASNTSCCNSRGNVLRQCKFTKASECYDPEGICCDLGSCQRKDLSVDGLTCESSHICEAASTSNVTIRDKVASKTCGALIAENTAGIYTACENKRCQSLECSRLGLEECSCTESSKQESEYGDYCGTCCQLHGNICVTAMAATSSAVIVVTQSYQSYLQENFLLHNAQTFREFMDNNSTSRRIWNSLQVRKTDHGEQKLLNPVDFSAISKEFCAVNGDPNTCLNTSFLHWPVGGPCVVQGAVSICDGRRICRMTYQALATTRDEIGIRQNQVQEYGDRPNSGIQQIVMRLTGAILSSLVSMYVHYRGYHARIL